MKPKGPCYCEAYDFPHEHWKTCYEYVSKDDRDNDEPFDDSERILDERDRARYVNEINRGVAK